MRRAAARLKRTIVCRDVRQTSWDRNRCRNIHLLWSSCQALSPSVRRPRAARATVGGALPADDVLVRRILGRTPALAPDTKVRNDRRSERHGGAAADHQPGGGCMPKYHSPPTIAAPLSCYSHAAEAPAGARWLYVSGQLGIKP